jgi:hypothetical protein
MINSVECRAQIEQRKQHRITSVSSQQHVVYDLQKCRLGRVMTSMGQLYRGVELIPFDMTNQLLSHYTFKKFRHEWETRYWAIARQ